MERRSFKKVDRRLWLNYSFPVSACAIALGGILLGSAGIAVSGHSETLNHHDCSDCIDAHAANPLRLPKKQLQTWIQQVRQEKNSFLTQVSRGSFVAFTGVEPREPIQLLEGATYHIAADNSITFTLSNGTVVPPLSQAGYDNIRDTLPAHQRQVLDDKLFWHLQRNPAMPLIAAGLERGDYSTLVENQVFDTDAFYLGPFWGHIFWAAQKADVSLEAVIPLVETHLLTLEFPYLRETDLRHTSGPLRSFYKYEQALTNQQYLLRSLIATPIEPWARLEAIQRVEASSTKQDYTDSNFVSTTIALGRLPLPTPTAAEDTPAVHALNIAHLADQGIALFPQDLEQAALDYQDRHKRQLAQETVVRQRLSELAINHGVQILNATDNYYSEAFWLQIGLTPTLSRQSVNQMDTSRLLGIFATRIEGLRRSSAAESYPEARQHFMSFFQKNTPGLSETELLLVLLCDQAFNPRFWTALKEQQPELLSDINLIQSEIRQLENDYKAAAIQEAAVFRVLQQHDLDITTEAFSLLSVAMAKRLSDLVDQEFQPGDRTHPDYLNFARGLYPFLRDMPDLGMQWGNGQDIKRYGLDNYVVPDLMALDSDHSPTLSAMGDLWFKMVSNNDLNRWDVETFIKFLNTGHNLSATHPPTQLPPAQVAMLPLVEKYRPELKRVTGADGRNAPAALHGLLRQDFRIETWPGDRQPGPSRLQRIDPVAIQQLFPDLSKDKIDKLIWHLSKGSSEFSLALPLVLLSDPLFVQREDGAVDLLFEFEGQQRVFPEISRHFESVYSPTYMTRIALPREPDPAYVEALNQVIHRTHALYGGYTARVTSLPAPLQTLQSE
ncbi:hypothetical protein PN498_08105 [Oscillatoria sp. CS-180]|uniref:hypothetical protein n=1 Tax=Oscillatoria sp. CS-180 TaxID=3021720 RepID=UPI00232BAA37|nr:hypothetical protein [Oscillatoria sp. CS-180]MDB9525945.1 hypothetical protein [Oscillatoria sp. CS-180]